MTTPHKWADAIKAWADGKPVQWNHIDSLDDWQDYAPGTSATPNFAASSLAWRVKPNTIKYRRYLYIPAGFPDAKALSLVHFTETFNEQKVVQGWGNQWVRWIDTEWQEVEV